MVWQRLRKGGRNSSARGGGIRWCVPYLPQLNPSEPILVVTKPRYGPMVISLDGLLDYDADDVYEKTVEVTP
jgi:hypothetical protein